MCIWKGTSIDKEYLAVTFSHLGIQFTECWFDKLPSFRILDTACLDLRHGVARDAQGCG
jgi:hypothetical protein